MGGTAAHLPRSLYANVLFVARTARNVTCSGCVPAVWSACCAVCTSWYGLKRSPVKYVLLFGNTDAVPQITATQLLAGTIEYATMTEPLQSTPTSASPPATPATDTPSFHGADALNYRAPAKAAASRLGRGVEFEAVAVPPGGCVVHSQDCWHGSAPNVSRKRHRRALVIHFLRGDVRFIDGHSLQVKVSNKNIELLVKHPAGVCVHRRRIAYQVYATPSAARAERARPPSPALQLSPHAASSNTTKAFSCAGTVVVFGFSRVKLQN